MTYAPEIVSGNVEYQIKGVYDYFPYGKILRSYEAENEKYLTTHHERDDETGFDYRGARFYDSDVARFLSLDPWADKYPEWSDYNYVLGNPIRIVDPTGKGGEDVVEAIKGTVVGWSDMQAGAVPLLQVTLEFIVPVEGGEEGETTTVEKVVSIYGAVNPGISVGDDLYIAFDPNSSVFDASRASAHLIFDAATLYLFAYTKTFAGSSKGSTSTSKPVRRNYSHLKDSKHVGPGKNFTRAQKRNILQANKERNGGVLRSDKSGKQLDQPVQSKKGEPANMNQAEVDHIDPKSKGGTNSHKNAQVLSKEENIDKSDK